MQYEAARALAYLCIPEDPFDGASSAGRLKELLQGVTKEVQVRPPAVYDECIPCQCLYTELASATNLVSAFWGNAYIFLVSQCTTSDKFAF